MVDSENLISQCIKKGKNERVSLLQTLLNYCDKKQTGKIRVLKILTNSLKPDEFRFRRESIVRNSIHCKSNIPVF